MTESGYGHIGRIPSYGNRGQPDNRMVEPPACIQNAMMTKDKKPFTYTPGGLDLSQIKTPSMARRLARQRSQEDQEQMYAPPSNGNTRTGGPPPPPPFQGGAPPPPPPPPLVIKTPAPGQAKPETVIRPIGERPEIVIPENPIGMLRKTNSPYHWEQEQVEREKLGAVPKFVEKIPSPVMQQNPPTAFSQQPPTTYTPQVQNNFQKQNNFSGQQNVHPASPVHKPEPQYPSPSIPSPTVHQTPTRDMIQRQDSQFNNSPTPFNQSNGSPISPTPNSAWRQPEKRDSPLVNSSPQQRSPFSPTNSIRSPQFTPTANTYSPQLQNENVSPVYHTLPRASPRVYDNYANNLRQSPPKNVFANTIYNNIRNETRSESPRVDPNNPTPWRTNTMRPQQQDNNNYSQPPSHNNSAFYRPESTQTVPPPWIKQNDEEQWNKNQVNSNPWKQSSNQNEQNNWKQQQNGSNTYRNQQLNSPPQAPEPRYQTTMNIPVVPRQAHFEQQRQQTQQKQSPVPQPHKEIVYVTEEPVYYCQPNPGSPKIVPAWVKTQKEKTPPPEWCQRPLESRKSLTREFVSPPKDRQAEPEWVQRSNDIRSAARDLSSPPPIHQTIQPTWSTKPSENRKSLDQPTYNGTQNGYGNQNTRFIPVQPNQSNGNDPHMRIIIDMQSPHNQAQPPYTQPTQRIMRVLSPQLVRLEPQEETRQQDLPSINNHQPKTRIIPIQIEGGGNETSNRRVYYHRFSTEGPPRQSKSFRVLQTITGTLDNGTLENQYGYTDL